MRNKTFRASLSTIFRKIWPIKSTVQQKFKGTEINNVNTVRVFWYISYVIKFTSSSLVIIEHYSLFVLVVFSHFLKSWFDVAVESRLFCKIDSLVVHVIMTRGYMSFWGRLPNNVYIATKCENQNHKLFFLSIPHILGYNEWVLKFSDPLLLYKAVCTKQLHNFWETRMMYCSYY